MAQITILPGIVQQFDLPTQEEFQDLLDRVQMLEERFPEQGPPLVINGENAYVQFADIGRSLIALAPFNSNDRFNITQVMEVLEIEGILFVDEVSLPINNITRGVNGVDAVVTFDTSNVSPGQRAKFFTRGAQVFT